MKSLLLLIFLISCSHHELQVDGKPKKSVNFIKHKNYYEIDGAGTALQNTEGGTLLITFRQTGSQDSPQDMLSFSVGSEKPTFFSRASLRMDKDGYLTGIARADDAGEAQNVRAKESVSTGDFHTAALVVDYKNNFMKLFLDGKPIETEGNVNFNSQRSSDTPSRSVSMGAEDDGSNFYFQGELKNPRVWSKPLTSEEILMNSSTP